MSGNTSKALQSNDNLIEIERLENTPELVKHKTVRKSIASKAAIKELYERRCSVREIANVLDLHEKHVSKIVKQLKDENLADSQFTSLASQALQKNLKNNNLDAVKIVYNHINKDIQTKATNNTQTNININFDGLSNPNGSGIISKKVTTHKESNTIDAVIVEDW